MCGVLEGLLNGVCVILAIVAIPLMVVFQITLLAFDWLSSHLCRYILWVDCTAEADLINAMEHKANMLVGWIPIGISHRSLGVFFVVLAGIHYRSLSWELLLYDVALLVVVGRVIHCNGWLAQEAMQALGEEYDELVKQLVWEYNVLNGNFLAYSVTNELTSRNKEVSTSREISRKNRTIQGFRQEISKLKSEIGKSKQSATSSDEIKRANTRLQLELEECQKENQMLKKLTEEQKLDMCTFNDLDENLKKKEAVIQKKKKKINKLKTRLDESEIAMTKQNQAMNGLRTNLEETKKSCTKMCQEIVQLKTELEEQAADEFQEESRQCKQFETINQLTEELALQKSENLKLSRRSQEQELCIQKLQVSAQTGRDLEDEHTALQKETDQLRRKLKCVMQILEEGV